MTGWALAQVELRLTVNPETTAFGRAEPFRAGISIQIGARGHARIEMHLYHFLAIDPAGVGRDYRRMLGEACFARPEARSCVGHAFAEAIFRSEEHTSELQSLMRISYAVFCLKKKTII